MRLKLEQLFATERARLTWVNKNGHRRYINKLTIHLNADWFNTAINVDIKFIFMSLSFWTESGTKGDKCTVTVISVCSLCVKDVVTRPYRCSVN